MTTSKIKDKQRKIYKELRMKSTELVEKSIFKEISKTLSIRQELGELKNYIGIYWPLPGEIDLRPLKRNPNLRLALPSSSSGRNISYHPWTNKPLKKDHYSIPSPISERILTPNEISMLLVPALAIDINGYRLGYGGGFFDKLRSKSDWKKIEALVVIPKICVSLNPLPRDKWDIPFEGWITEEGEFKNMKNWK